MQRSVEQIAQEIVNRYLYEPVPNTTVFDISNNHLFDMICKALREERSMIEVALSEQKQELENRYGIIFEDRR